MLVEGNVLKFFIHTEDEYDIVEGVFYLPVLIKFQESFPIGRTELTLGGFFSFKGKLFFNFIILHGKLAHGGKGLLIVQIAEFVDADDVKGIEKHSTGGVCRMVAVCELVIVEHNTCGRVCRYVIVSAFHSGRSVDIRQELVDGILHRIGPAEHTDNAVLFKRVCLLLCSRSSDFAFTA